MVKIANKIRKSIFAIGLLIASFPMSIFAYELPSPDRQQAHAVDLSVHNAMFLRNQTNASVIGYLIKEGGNFKLIDDIQRKEAFGIHVEIHPKLSIDPALIDKKVRVTGRMTYQTMYMPDTSVLHEPSYSFKMELYKIEGL